MEMHLTDDGRMIQETIRSWVAKECPRAAVHAWDAAAAIPDAIFRQLADLGFCGITVPEAYGGQGSSFEGAGIVIEELAYGCAALASRYAGTVLGAGTVFSALGDERQREAYLGKAAAGTLRVAMVLGEVKPGPTAEFTRTRWAAVGDEFVLTGETPFVLDASPCDLFLVPSVRSEGEPALVVFCVEAGESNLFVEPVDKLGYRGVSLGRVRMDGVRVSAESVLGGSVDPCQGEEQLLRILDWFALGTAAQAVGLARAALDYSVEYVKERVQFGQPIGRFPVIREALADTSARTAAARIVLREACLLADRGHGFSKRAHTALFLAAEAAKKAAFEGLQFLGGYGYSMEYEAQRYVRDATGLGVVGPGAEFLKARIADSLGLP